MGGHQTIDVRLEPAHAGWRLDRALAAAVPTLSRERLKALIRSGAVEAQGAAVRDPATKVKGDESLQRRRARAAAGAQRAAGHSADDRLRGRAFAGGRQAGGPGRPPGRGQFRRHVGQRAAAPLRRFAVGIGGVARPGIVHRIDKDTSGLLVVAKTDVAHEGWRNSSPPTRSTAAISRSSRACRRPAEARSTLRSPARRPTARRSRSSKDGRAASAP